jgi:hypothetical protein
MDLFIALTPSVLSSRIFAQKRHQIKVNKLVEISCYIL